MKVRNLPRDQRFALPGALPRTPVAATPGILAPREAKVRKHLHSQELKRADQRSMDLIQAIRKGTKMCEPSADKQF